MSVSSVMRVHGVVRQALQQAVKWGWRADNPALLANPGKPRKAKVRLPTKAEVLELLAAAEGKDLELLTFLFLDAETGARRGELAALRVSDFDDDAVTIARALTVGLMTEENLRAYQGHIWPAERPRGNLPTVLIEKDVPKNEGSMRTISLSPATIDLVRLQRVRLTEAMLGIGLVYPEDGFLFPSTPEGARPWRPDTWTHRFIRLRDGLGLGVRLQDVRHFVATTLLTSGVDLATVAGRLGPRGRRQDDPGYLLALPTGARSRCLGPHGERSRATKQRSRRPTRGQGASHKQAHDQERLMRQQGVPGGAVDLRLRTARTMSGSKPFMAVSTRSSMARRRMSFRRPSARHGSSPLAMSS